MAATPVGKRMLGTIPRAGSSPLLMPPSGSKLIGVVPPQLQRPSTPDSTRKFTLPMPSVNQWSYLGNNSNTQRPAVASKPQQWSYQGNDPSSQRVTSPTVTSTPTPHPKPHWSNQGSDIPAQPPPSVTPSNPSVTNWSIPRSPTSKIPSSPLASALASALSSSFPKTSSKGVDSTPAKPSDEFSKRW